MEEEKILNKLDRGNGICLTVFKEFKCNFLNNSSILDINKIVQITKFIANKNPLICV